MNSHSIKIFSIVFLMTIMVTLVSSQGLIVPFGTEGVNYSINVNHSYFSDAWITNIGTLTDVDANQHNNVGGVLTISETYLKSWADLIYAPLSSLANYLPLAGGTMTGDINMGGNDIIYGGANSSFNTSLLIDGDTTGGNATLVIDSDLNKYSCINLTEGGRFGFQICNDGAGSNRFVIANADTGQEWMWIDRDDGTINFLNITEVHSNLIAEYFIGDGSGLTNLNTTLLNATLNGSFLSIDGSNAIQNIDIGLYNLTANAFFGDTANFTTLIVGNANIEDTYWNFTKLLNGTLVQNSTLNTRLGDYIKNNTDGYVIKASEVNVTGYGYFSWLGNLANKITTIFAVTIHADVLNSTGTIYSNQTCYTQDCSARIYHNGTGIIITS